MKLTRTILILTAVFIGVYSECSVTPKCTCPYGTDAVGVEEKVQSTEVLAGTVGALSSIAVSGGAFGIWQLLKSRIGNSSDVDSVLEDEEEDVPDQRRRGSRIPFKGDTSNVEEETSFKPPNIYSAGKNDTINHRVGVPRSVMTVDDF